MGKKLDKNATYFYDRKKVLTNAELEETYFYIIKAEYEKPTANIIWNRESLGSNPI